MPAKRTAIFNQDRGKQHGAVLMVMLVIMIIGIAAILVSSLTSAALKNARQQNTAAALAQAKEALIGFAITYGDTHSGQVDGYLPCPDYVGGNPEGSAEPTCGSQNVSVIGRLPWATLDLSALRDGDGECLWYAVSGNYKNNPNTSLMMNWDTPGQFQAYAADGTQLTNPNEVVAVIFAPGAAQTGQDRSGTTAPVCGGNYTASSYLDTDTAHSIRNWDVASGKFIQGTSGGTVNDQMIFITKQDIWNTLKKQLTNPNSPLRLVTNQVALCLANYGKNNYPSNNWGLPWPAPIVLSNYSDQTQYIDYTNIYAGRVPYSVINSKSSTLGSYNQLVSSPWALLQSNGAYCPNPTDWQNKSYPWWSNWKEHFFYAIAKEFRPSPNQVTWPYSYPNTNQSCSQGPCLSINGSGQYAAVVMFAGPRLSSQTADTSTVSNYLEGNNVVNVANYIHTNGNENYQTGPASSTFNDILYCIKQDLSVVPCP